MRRKPVDVYCSRSSWVSDYLWVPVPMLGHRVNPHYVVPTGYPLQKEPSPLSSHLKTRCLGESLLLNPLSHYLSAALAVLPFCGSARQTVKMDHLGPVIVNADGSLRRIANWPPGRPTLRVPPDPPFRPGKSGWGDAVGMLVLVTGGFFGAGGDGEWQLGLG